MRIYIIISCVVCTRKIRGAVSRDRFGDGREGWLEESGFSTISDSDSEASGESPSRSYDQVSVSNHKRA